VSRSVFTTESRLQSGYIGPSANKRADLMKCSVVSARDGDLDIAIDDDTPERFKRQIDSRIRKIISCRFGNDEDLYAAPSCERE